MPLKINTFFPLSGVNNVSCKGWLYQMYEKRRIIMDQNGIWTQLLPQSLVSINPTVFISQNYNNTVINFFFQIHYLISKFLRNGKITLPGNWWRLGRLGIISCKLKLDWLQSPSPVVGPLEIFISVPIIFILRKRKRVLPFFTCHIEYQQVLDKTKEPFPTF